MKVLSPVIYIVAPDQGFHLPEISTAQYVKASMRGGVGV